MTAAAEQEDVFATARAAAENAIENGALRGDPLGYAILALLDAMEQDRADREASAAETRDIIAGMSEASSVIEAIKQAVRHIVFDLRREVEWDIRARLMRWATAAFFIGFAAACGVFRWYGAF